MKRATSLYLDLVRFAAAMVVFAGHLGHDRWSGGLLWQFRALGLSAVVVFFVLSGFVIAYVTDGPENSGRAYAISRLARLYSVVLPALVLSLLFDAIGQFINPASYAIQLKYLGPGLGPAWEAAICGLFLNETWDLSVVVGTNVTFWSLGFEVWYYVIFGLALFAPGRWRWIGVLAAICVAGPKVALMLPLWLLGVGCYHLTRRCHIGAWTGLALYVGSAAALAWFNWSGIGGPEVSPADPMTLTPGRFVGYLSHYMTGLMFALHLVGFDAFGSHLLPILNRIARPIRWAAGATFTMYLLHLPTLELLAALTPWPVSSLASRTLVVGGTMVVVFAVAEVTERRKDAWRRLFTRLVGQGVSRGLTEPT